MPHACVARLCNYYSLVKVPLSLEKIATKGLDAISSRIRTVKEHIKVCQNQCTTKGLTMMLKNEYN